MEDNDFFMELALLTAKRSEDPETQVRNPQMMTSNSSPRLVPALSKMVKLFQLDITVCQRVPRISHGLKMIKNHMVNENLLQLSVSSYPFSMSCRI